MAEISCTKIMLKVEGASDMQAFVARPASAAKAPGLMVFQEAFGVTAHIRDIAERCAREGYTAIAPELFHRTLAPGTLLGTDDFSKVIPHYQAMTNEGTTADLKACYDWLSKDSRTDATRIGCVGFCLGGRTSFLANAALPLKAAISFYGGGIGPGRGATLLDLAPQMHGPILFFWGGKDAHITHEATRPIEDALDAAGKDYVNVRISSADHAFMREGSASYNEKAAKMAWKLSVDFLDLNVMKAK
jgi:carboxymethylenebutenolidase